MNPKEQRRIWVCTDPTGRPYLFTWAGVKTLAECPPGKEPSYWCALHEPDKQPEHGYDAQPTQWRRVPPHLVQAIEENSPDLRIAGRAIECAGLRCHLDDTGRPRAGDQEPDEPDSEIADSEAALAALEARASREKADLEARLRARLSALGAPANRLDDLTLVALAQSGWEPPMLRLRERGTGKMVAVAADPARAQELLESHDEVVVRDPATRAVSRRARAVGVRVPGRGAVAGS